MKSTPAVLVVDDEPGIRSLLKIVVERTGCTVDLASDGHEALEKIRSGASYDLVLLDLMMPR
jgi:osomolarity two-component system, response regulator SKN7